MTMQIQKSHLDKMRENIAIARNILESVEVMGRRSHTEKEHVWMNGELRRAVRKVEAARQELQHEKSIIAKAKSAISKAVQS